MVRIVVIDTGVNMEHPLLKSYQNIYGFGVSLNADEELVIQNDYVDEVGHGTAIAYVLCKYIKDLELIIVKAFNSTQNVEEKKIIKLLEYIDENYSKIDIISMSFGITLCDEKERLEKICMKLYQKGTIMVAAYDNFGKMTYPACFDSVLGIDVDMKIKKVFEYIYVKNSCVNIRANSVKHRLPGLEDEMISVYGTSFAVPYIDVIVAEIIEKYGCANNVFEELERRAKKVIDYASKKSETKKIVINSAIVFPYQKETKNIVRYSKMDIYGIYDVKNSGNIGKSIKSVTQEVDYKVEDVNKIEWDGKFDAVIIGYCRSKNIAPEVLMDVFSNCKKYGKQIYSFTNENFYDSDTKLLTESRLINIAPQINDFWDNKFGKMWDISKPVLCIAGTSSIQGKFSTQIAVRDEMEKMGYKVGHLGTEPYSILLDCDECYPYGYDSNISISPANKILLVNELMHRIELKNPDIILTGLQSNLWHYGSGNVAFYPTDQYEVLAGVNPDAMILCVNYNDDMEYIYKNLIYIEKVWELNCIAIVLFPFEKKFTMENASDFEFSNADINKLYKKIEEIEMKCKIPVLQINEKGFSKKLTDYVIEFF